MDAHEKELYRMELEVNRINAAQSSEQEQKVAQVRKDFDLEIEKAIQNENCLLMEIKINLHTNC